MASAASSVATAAAAAAAATATSIAEHADGVGRDGRVVALVACSLGLVVHFIAGMGGSDNSCLILANVRV